MSAEILMAIALLCGQPTRVTMGVPFALTDDVAKWKCQKDLAECVSKGTPKTYGQELFECVRVKK